MLKPICCILALPIALASAHAQNGGCLTLPGAIEAALDFDPRITSSLADRDSARANVMAANARNLPQVSLFGRTGQGDNAQFQVPLSQQNQLGLQANQEIYSSGQRRFAQEAAKANARAATYDVEETKLDVARGVALAFLDLQRSERLLEIAQEQEATFARDAEAAESRLSRRIITLTDASQVQARLSVARSTRINAQVAVETARVRLAVLTDTPLRCIDQSSTEAFVGKDAQWLLSMPMDAAVDEAFSRSINLRRSRAQIDSARASLREANRSNMPTISGYALQIDYYDQTFDTQTDRQVRENIEEFGFDLEGRAPSDRYSDETRIGLTLNQDLFTGGRNKARRSDARARLRRAESDRDFQRIVVEDLVRRSLAQARAQQKAGMELLDATAQARIQLDNTLTEYERSTKTLTDLTLAYEGYYRTLRDETEARFEFYSSLIGVYAAMGTLTDGIGR